MEPMSLSPLTIDQLVHYLLRSQLDPWGRVLEGIIS